MTLLFNSENFEKRAAILENGRLVEFYREKSRRAEVIGNIYKGKVLRVMPGLESAFIDIGLGKAAFLSLSDMCAEQPARIGDLLKRKDEILVQVIRDPVRNKGVKLTARVSLASCALVFNPFFPQSSVSAKIFPKGERKRLSTILSEIAPADAGLIARTNSAGMDKAALISARDELLKRWGDIQKKAATAKAPKLIYEEASLFPRLLREIRQSELDEVIADDAEISCFLPPDFPNDKLTLYNDDVPLFTRYGVEDETARVLNRRVRLPSGGYIIIDQTEALTVIDVNTGRFIGSLGLEQTAFDTNSEAAEEIARILRLRNIGGIIIVDFIDMQNAENREKVSEKMNSLLSRDRAKAFVVDITPLGLMEITRKRSGESLISSMYEPCAHCGGKGLIKDADTVCVDVLREFKAEASKNSGQSMVIEAAPEISEMLSGKDAAAIAAQYNIALSIIPRSSFRKDSYLITAGACRREV
jgi:ribonuclease G